MITSLNLQSHKPVCYNIFITTNRGGKDMPEKLKTIRKKHIVLPLNGKRANRKTSYSECTPIYTKELTVNKALAAIYDIIIFEMW